MIKNFGKSLTIAREKNFKNFKLKLFQMFLKIRSMTSDFSESLFYIFR